MSIDFQCADETGSTEFFKFQDFAERRVLSYSYRTLLVWSFRLVVKNSSNLVFQYVSIVGSIISCVTIL